MSSYVITSINNGKSEFFDSEAAVLEAFDEAQWRLMQRGYYLPWIDVKEIKPLVTRFAPSVSEEHTLPWSSGSDEFPIKKPLKIAEKNSEEGGVPCQDLRLRLAQAKICSLPRK